MTVAPAVAEATAGAAAEATAGAAAKMEEAAVEGPAGAAAAATDAKNHLQKCPSPALPAGLGFYQAAVFFVRARAGRRRHSRGPSKTAEQIPRPYARAEENASRALRA